MPERPVEPPIDSGSHDKLTPRELDAINEQLIRRAEADPDNWCEDETGRYYVGPKFANDGTIEWPERVNEHGNVIDYGPQFGEDDDAE